MATSRTGTAKYLRNRRRVLAQAKADGLTHCPGYQDPAGVHKPCGRELNWDIPQLPESVEADHILAPKHGGTDDADNLTPLCRSCNATKSDGTRTPIEAPTADDFPVSRDWFGLGVGGAPARSRRSPWDPLESTCRHASLSIL